MLSTEHYDIITKDNTVLASFKGILNFEVIKSVYSDMNEVISEHSNLVDFIVADFRQITGLVLLPEDFKIMPQLSKNLESSGNFNHQSKSALLFSNEEYHLAAVLLGMIVTKSEEKSHPVVSFLDLDIASEWLGIDVNALLSKAD